MHQRLTLYFLCFFFEICRIAESELVYFWCTIFLFVCGTKCTTGRLSARQWYILCRRQIEKMCIKSKQAHQNLKHRLKRDAHELKNALFRHNLIICVKTYLVLFSPLRFSTTLHLTSLLLAPYFFWHLSSLPDNAFNFSTRQCI